MVCKVFYQGFAEILKKLYLNRNPRILEEVLIVRLWHRLHKHKYASPQAKTAFSNYVN